MAGLSEKTKETACAVEAGTRVAGIVNANDEQMKQVDTTKGAFDMIKNNIEEVNDGILQQSNYMLKVVSSNNEISSHVEKISEFSVELLANTENTRDVIGKTISGTEQISTLIAGVMRNLDGLKHTIE